MDLLHCERIHSIGLVGAVFISTFCCCCCQDEPAIQYKQRSFVTDATFIYNVCINLITRKTN